MKERIAGLLLDIEAVFLRPNKPFTWASGIKSPIYCDNRMILSFPEVRKVVEKALAEIVTIYYPSVEVIAGTSTAGIAHAAYVSEILNLPMVYVRGSAKDHGRQNLIEGKIEEKQKVVVIEDLISTGGSVVEVVEALREAGAEVLGIASIFTYEMEKGIERLKGANVTNYSLSGFTPLITVALERGYIKESDVKKLLAFQKNPSDSSWQDI